MTHYYGDIVRRLFLIGAFIMAATLPYFASDITEPLLMSIMGILILLVAAGLSSPLYRSSSLLNVLIALAGVIFFEQYAVRRYAESGMDLFFWVNQILTLVFLIALYYGVKTLRNIGIVRAASGKS